MGQKIGAEEKDDPPKTYKWEDVLTLKPRGRPIEENFFDTMDANLTRIQPLLTGIRLLVEWGGLYLNLAPTIYCGLKRLAFKARFIILILTI